MVAPAKPSQLDLFAPAPEPARQRGGIPRHIPSAEDLLLAKEMKAAGARQDAIAKALGICTSTLATHYFPSRTAKPPKGRRRHEPTPATRRIVRRAVRAGMAPASIAKLIGISPPTLRLYYRQELQI